MKKKQRDTKKAQKKAQHRAEKRKVARERSQERALAALASMPLPPSAMLPMPPLREWPFDRMCDRDATKILSEVRRVAPMSSPSAPRFVADAIAVVLSDEGELDHFVGAQVTVVQGLNASGLPVVEIEQCLNGAETMEMVKAGRLTMPGHLCPPHVAHILRPPTIAPDATTAPIREMSSCG